MLNGRMVSFAGRVQNRVIGTKKAPLSWRLKNAIRPNFIFGYLGVQAAKALTALTGIPTLTSCVKVFVENAEGEKIDYGTVGYRVVTDVGVNAIVDAFQNTFEVENFNYHGIGTGGDLKAEGADDTALQTELTTEYSTDNTRATGTQGEGASANIYQSVGTNSVDAAVAIDEHGLFDQAATGGGTLLDRTVFAEINLTSGDSLQSTYELTVNSGG